MCTILFLHHAHPDMSLVVAANRDEHYARPSDPPGLRSEQPRVVAGLDRRAGGTWLGVNEHGLLLGLTNQRSYEPADLAKRSRGEIVLSALQARSVDEVMERLVRLVPDDYNPFNLLFGDGETLHAAYAHKGTACIEFAVAPEGVHVLPNDRIGAPGFPKAERACALVKPAARMPWSTLQPALAAALGDHALPPLAQVPAPPTGAALDHEQARQLQAICLHGPGYGTCSSSIVALRPREVVHYLHADGPPCTATFREVTHLLR